MGLALALAMALALGSPARGAGPASAPPPLVAHAGGGLAGDTYWNTLEALEANYARGFRTFELDFHWTDDRVLVLIHDWGRAFVLHYGVYDPPFWEEILSDLTGKQTRPKLEVFLRMGRDKGITPLTAEGLAQWMERHPDAEVITDVKEDNLAALTQLRDRFPRLVPRIIPQVYHFEEYDPVRRLGYERIILTLYAIDASDDQVVAFAGKARPWAVTLPRKQALETDLVPRLHGLGLFVYVHAINDPEELQELLAAGAGGVYTDFLPPSLPEALSQAKAGGGKKERAGPSGRKGREEPPEGSR